MIPITPTILTTLTLGGLLVLLLFWLATDDDFPKHFGEND